MYNECRKHEKEEVITTVGAEVRSRRAPYRVRSGGRGRPPAPPSDIVMFLVLKTLFCDSYRGTYSLLAADSTVVMLAGMTTVPHYNTAQKYCSRISENFLQSLLHSITVVLRKCRRLNIAGDGTGFGTKRYLCWFVSRKAGKKRKRQFVKLHLCISIWPAIVLSASVTKGTVADIKMLDTLLDVVDDAIVIGDVCLDPGYLSRYAVQSISDHGGLPVIKLKCNTTARAAAVPEWHRMVRTALDHPGPYKRKYSKRSVIEGIIAAIKMRFGEMIYSRKTRNQRVELMLRLIVWDAMAVMRIQ